MILAEYLFDAQTRFWGQFACFAAMAALFLWTAWPAIQQGLDHRWRVRVIKRADQIPEEQRCSRCEGTGFYDPILRVSARFPSWHRAWVKCLDCRASGRLRGD